MSFLGAIANSRRPYEVKQNWPKEANFDHLPTEDLEEVMQEAIEKDVTYEYDKNTCMLHMSKRCSKGSFKLPHQLGKAKEFLESIA